ncbi:hypothetical protein ACFOY8_13870 [Thalassospira xianhensis]|uniref:Uncharacterized protein n=2 Tax=Thalassospira TaxID=168934 RepID=A0A285TSA3_9PROT|nr:MULTISPECIES: hypothetical protein [Thalassospira]RCK07741.1 hypothetical protein TH5_01405 [Thalassospira xianhensis MCCC 1A02616]SOC26701.1 hypothetical protein SAMN05428964_105176 [Thalassospira xiamenensis]
MDYRRFECAINGSGDVAVFLPFEQFAPVGISVVAHDKASVIRSNKAKTGLLLPYPAIASLKEKKKLLVVEVAAQSVIKREAWVPIQEDETVEK